MVSDAYDLSAERPNAQSPKKLPRFTLSRLSQLNLRTKATILAIALGTLPVAAIGGAAYVIADATLLTQLNASEQAQTVALADKVNRFMFERYADVQAVANLPSVSNRLVQQSLPLQEQTQILTRYAQFYGIYDSIATFDLNGNVVAQSAGPTLENHRDRVYFQEALQTGRPVFTQPEVAKETGETVVYFAAPIRDSATSQIIGVVRTRMPLKYVDALLINSGQEGHEYHLIDASGTIVLAQEKDQIGRSLLDDFPALKEVPVLDQAITVTGVDRIDNAQQVISYAPFGPLGQDLPSLQWSTVMAIDTAKAYTVQQNLLRTIALGTAFTAALVATLAAYLVNRATRPIEQAAEAVGKIGQGELSTRLVVDGEDEVAQLGRNINQMAAQLEHLIEEQQAEAGRIELARQEARQEADTRAEEQRQAKEFLQRRALELLMEVDPVSQGDLTVRATVTSDEVGTIADSYNAIIRSLRQIVEQVKQASQSVSETAVRNEATVINLSTEAKQQMQAIATTLEQIQSMGQSIQGVARRAQQAEHGVQIAAKTIHAGDEAMNRTVEGISTIRETVAETAKKVKRLGEASQKISKVVNLIGDFAAQTNLLALNASIEAARAGEEGRGFAVVAEEVRSLAQQSVAATTEIEQLVEEIQSQTNEVVVAMEAGTDQVVHGTKLVEESRQKLSQITEVSQQINTLVREIAQAAVVQTKNSTTVSKTMQQVAAIASGTSQQSEHVAQSFDDLVQVAQALQVSVAQFKI